MDDKTFELEFDRALALAEMGKSQDAMAVIAPLLAEDPDWAEGHAVMASLLIDCRLIAAARKEVEYALGLQPDSGYIHATSARVCIAEGQLDSADACARRAVELEPEDHDHLLLLAAIRTAKNDNAGALPLLERARELEPNEPDVLVAWSEFEVTRVDYAQAYKYALEALEENPEHLGALIQLGHVQLRRGETGEAEELMRDALAAAPENDEALRLLASVKSSQSRLLGAWWRYSVWLESKSDRNQLIFVLGGFVIYRFVVLVAEDLAWPGLADWIRHVWLGLCAYTWIGPALFQRMVNKEIEKVILDEEY